MDVSISVPAIPPDRDPSAEDSTHWSSKICAAKFPLLCAIAGAAASAIANAVAQNKPESLVDIVPPNLCSIRCGCQYRDEGADAGVRSVTTAESSSVILEHLF